MKINLKYIILYISMLLAFGCSHLISTLIPFNSLPAPKGKFHIGTSIYHWKDSTRLEWFTYKKTDFRELMVQIWYPAEAGKNIKKVPYMDNINKRIPEISKQIGIPVFMLKHLSNVTTNSFIDLKPIEGKLPVLIFSHGLGGMRTQNTVYMEMLASNGYAVIAMDHPYDANITIYPDGEIALYSSSLPENTSDSLALLIRHKQLDTRSADVSYVINQLEKLNNGEINSYFKDKLLLNKIGVFGHSFGGATSIHAAFNDERITACLTLDPWYVPVQDIIIDKGLNKPFLHIGQAKWENPLNYKKRDLFFLNSGKNSTLITINKTKHFDFMDMPLFTSITKKLGFTGSMESSQLYMILTKFQLEFFNSYVKGFGTFSPQNENKIIEDIIVNSKKYNSSQIIP